MKDEAEDAPRNSSFCFILHASSLIFFRGCRFPPLPFDVLAGAEIMNRLHNPALVAFAMICVALFVLVNAL